MVPQHVVLSFLFFKLPTETRSKTPHVPLKEIIGSPADHHWTEIRAEKRSNGRLAGAGKE